MPRPHCPGPHPGPSRLARKPEVTYLARTQVLKGRMTRTHLVRDEGATSTHAMLFKLDDSRADKFRDFDGKAMSPTIRSRTMAV
ncbi:hypothetical protein HNQ99_002291 [Rhizorhapis suberifaciens]|uniref:Uncharacterized protein n=1 Tax=Rhizorhapis suberifaciens TaxID=13656 RepID=A0A840HVI4_9SPHN|nr:hypothetical protein [Rhizorhapis suberifaciens]